MRVTFYLFAKTGALKACQTFAVDNLNEIGAINGPGQQVIDWYCRNKDHEQRHKTESGWLVSGHNPTTGEYYTGIFHKK